ncbi:MAG: pyridoxal-dependent decarboxylase, exosortase A system-associated [Janthinobacterium lividum]
MTKPPVQHASSSNFPVQDGCLQVGGMALTRLAARVGQTPFFAYDRRLLDERVASLRALLPADVDLHYSVKANPMPAVVQHMARLVDGLDVASGGELRVALDTVMPASQISFAGPAKTDAELSQAIAAGVLISLESLGQAENAARIGADLGIQARVLLRVNPDFEMKSSGMRMGGGAKQFGIDSEQAPAALEAIGKLGLDFHGLQIFSGSQSLNAGAIIEAQARTLALACTLAACAPCTPRLINIGGGFGIPYFPVDVALDVAPISAALAEAMAAFRQVIPQARIVIELGRYLVGEAGVYVTRVVDRKVSRGQVFLVTDGGMNHHLAASGNLGQVIRKNYPVMIGNRLAAEEREIVSVVGPLCTPLDMLADRMALPVAQVGDLVVVLQSGAYGASASPVGFLSRPAAVEVLL